MEIRNHVYHFSVEPKLTGKRIKELRKERNMTAQNLADALLCSVKTVSSWETGARFPSIDNLVDLSNFFDVSVHSLMLPLDNCPVDSIGFFPDENEMRRENPIYFVESSSDNEIAALLTREEYLLQRIASGVFTNKNKYEYNAITEAFHYDFAPLPGNGVAEQSFLEPFWNTKKNHVYRSEMKSIIFNRILRGENLDQILKAMDLFERSVFFTTLCYFSELRTWDCTKMLYESGARFIDCDFIGNSNKIEKGILEKEKERLFNITYGTFEEVYGFSGEYVPSFYRDLRGWPVYSENPAFYETKHFCLIGDDCKDPKERKKLAAYYYLFDFITDSVESLTDLEQRLIASTKDFYAYINELEERGLIAK